MASASIWRGFAADAAMNGRCVCGIPRHGPARQRRRARNPRSAAPALPWFRSNVREAPLLDAGAVQKAYADHQNHDDHAVGIDDGHLNRCALQFQHRDGRRRKPRVPRVDGRERRKKFCSLTYFALHGAPRAAYCKTFQLCNLQRLPMRARPRESGVRAPTGTGQTRHDLADFKRPRQRASVPQRRRITAVRHTPVTSAGGRSVQ